MTRPRVLVLPLIAITLSGLVPPLAAQSSDAGSTELPPILPREREIALARSAAPPEVSAEATVLALVRGKGYDVAVAGTNGVTCLVSRSWPQAIEPHCFDPEGSRTILRVHLREAELKEMGSSKEEIHADIAEGFRTGRFSPPARPAMSWMMSGAQELYSDEGRPVGAWKPHLMIYHPWLAADALGFDASLADGPAIVDAGRPTSNIVIVVPSFVEPVWEPAPSGTDQEGAWAGATARGPEPTPASGRGGAG